MKEPIVEECGNEYKEALAKYYAYHNEIIMLLVKERATDGLSLDIHGGKLVEAVLLILKADTPQKAVTLLGHVLELLKDNPDTSSVEDTLDYFSGRDIELN